MTPTASVPTSKRVASYTDIEGWFFWEDRTLFDALLEAQAAPGTLIELGTYLGRSAVIIADHLRSGERFVVVDLFGAEVQDAANRSENGKSYATLTRARFEANYLALHTQLPEVVQGLSTEIVRHVAAGSARFVHVDASHLYAQVADDIRAVRSLVAPDAVVVFDDYRAEHTPGVAAAVWEAVAHGFVPFALTRYKLYGTWGDGAAHLSALRDLLATEQRMTGREQQISGHSVLILNAAPASAPSAKTAAANVATKAAAKRAAQASRPRHRSDFVPPIVADWVRARRRAVTPHR